jgi:hypothetical protein
MINIINILPSLLHSINIYNHTNVYIFFNIFYIKQNFIYNNFIYYIFYFNFSFFLIKLQIFANNAYNFLK